MQKNLLPWGLRLHRIQVAAARRRHAVKKQNARWVTRLRRQHKGGRPCYR